MKYYEKTIDSNIIFEGEIITLDKQTVILPNGNTAPRELVYHNGGVGILPVKENGNIILVKQYRKAVDMELLEIPAGKLYKGEDHRQCGIRELQEETGYSAKNFEYLGYFYGAVGFCNEKSHMYLATDLTEGQQNLDHDEFLNTVEISLEKCLEMIENGEIVDGKTIITIQKYKLRLGEK